MRIDQYKDSLRDEINKHFEHAAQQHENARASSINSSETKFDENEIYWQGRKDAIRTLQVVIFGSDDNFSGLAVAIDNEEHYKSPDPEEEEITELKTPAPRLRDSGE